MRPTGGQRPPREWRRPRRRDDTGTSLAELLVVLGLLGLVGTLVMSVSVQTTGVTTRTVERGGDTQDLRVAMDAVTRALRSAVDPDVVPAVPGSVCTPAATDGSRCAILDRTSTPDGLRSGPGRIVFWSSLRDLPPSPAPSPATTGTCDPVVTAGVDGHLAPRLVKFELTPAGELVEETWTKSQFDNGCVGTVAPRRRVLARQLDTTRHPAFTYLSAGDARDGVPADPTRLLPQTGPMPSSLTAPPDPAAPNDLTAGLLDPSDVGQVAVVEIHLDALRSRGSGRVSVVDSVALVNDPEVIRQ